MDKTKFDTHRIRLLPTIIVNIAVLFRININKIAKNSTLFDDVNSPFGDRTIH